MLATIHRAVAASCVVGSLLLGAASASNPIDRSGETSFAPLRDEAQTPELFQLEPHTFAWKQRTIAGGSSLIEVSEVTFPSPVTTPHEANNTVHCEYFAPRTEGPHAAVIVLHILGGDFDLSRLFCRNFANNGVAALFVKLPYYGPRRVDGVDRRMISKDPQVTVAGFRQAVLDIRRGAAWLASRDEVDPDRLGIFGISLGGITGALAATAEPRLQNVCLMLAGGDMVRIAAESEELAPLRKEWLAEGRDLDQFLAAMKQIDPVEYGANVRGRRILMMNGKHDRVIPPSCTESLWRAFGEPEIVWMEAGHYTAAQFLLDGLGRATAFFVKSPPQQISPSER